MVVSASGPSRQFVAMPNLAAGQVDDRHQIEKAAPDRNVHQASPSDGATPETATP